MIMRAIERGVSEDRTAKARNVNVGAIRTKVNLMNGICPEAANLLKEKQCPVQTFSELRKMNAIQQVEAVELMIATNSFPRPYARA